MTRHRTFKLEFICDHCGATLPVEPNEDRGTFRSDEMHECFGDPPGLVAYGEEGKGLLKAHDGVRVNISWPYL